MLVGAIYNKFINEILSSVNTHTYRYISNRRLIKFKIGLSDVACLTIS